MVAPSAQTNECNKKKWERRQLKGSHDFLPEFKFWSERFSDCLDHCRHRVWNSQFQARQKTLVYWAVRSGLRPGEDGPGNLTSSKSESYSATTSILNKKHMNNNNNNIQSPFSQVPQTNIQESQIMLQALRVYCCPSPGLISVWKILELPVRPVNAQKVTMWQEMTALLLLKISSASHASTWLGAKEPNHPNTL